MGGGEVSLGDLLGKISAQLQIPVNELKSNPELILNNSDIVKQYPGITELISSNSEVTSFDNLLQDQLATSLKPHLDSSVEEKSKANQTESLSQVDSKIKELDPKNNKADLAFLINKQNQKISKKQTTNLETQSADFVNLKKISTLKSKTSNPTKQQLSILSQSDNNLIKKNDLKLNKNLDSTMGNTDSSETKVLSMKEFMANGGEFSDSGNNGDASHFNTNSKMNNNTDSSRVSQTFNLNNIDLSGGADSVIEQVKNYIIQNSASNTESVQMSFNHQELGDIELLVRKTDNNMVAIEVSASQIEGQKFFKQNQTNLIQTLSQNGVNVSEFKLDSGSNTQNNDSSGQFAKNENPEGQSQQKRQNQENSDSERRRELWELFSNKEAA